MEIGIFCFNPFQENTYVLSDESKECIIIDPGVHNKREQEVLVSYIESKNLKPVKLVNTHCHIDHVLGNRFIADKYDLPLISHKGEQGVLDMQPQISDMYQIPYDPSPAIAEYLDEDSKLEFGNIKMDVLFTPGHSPASISFYHKDSKTLIAGDVLFDGSIGRTDLPGGDFDTLINSVRTKFFTLEEDTIVYPGHGPSTTIGKEKVSNPFFQQN
jgi:glyoxylase-like metal-dependent hydrolase (beta-lactamase superfamily II)